MMYLCEVMQMRCEQEKSRFLDALCSGTLFHSYIIESASTAFADDFLSYARSVLMCSGDKKPCGICPDCRKLSADSHPDVLICGGDDKPANMEAVRNVIALSHVPPSEGTSCIFIFKCCEKMRWDAQNALLKLLEEPPPYVRILLSTAKKEAVLPTVRSRCRLITLTDEPPAKTDKASTAAKDRAQKTLQMLSGGSRRFDFFVFMTEKQTRDKAVLYLSALYAELTDMLKMQGSSAELATFMGKRAICGMADAVFAAKGAAEANANLSSLFAALAIRLWELKK